MMDLLTSAMDAGAALAETFSKPVNTGASFTRYGTVVKNNGTTLDVELCGATLAAVPMLTTCAGAKAGDRCLLTVDGPLVTVTGILANADNTHSVRLDVTNIPSGFFVTAWKNTNTVTIKWSNKSDFPFGSATEKWGVTLGHIPAEYAPKEGIHAVGIMTTQYWNAGITNVVNIRSDGSIELSYKGGKPINCYGSVTYAL